MSGRAASPVPRGPSACVAEALEPRRLFDAGLLDVQFNPVGGGAAVTNFRNANENGRAVLPMSDGRVIVVGEYRGTGLSAVNDWGGFALVRHNADGSYDPSFGPGGSVRTRGPAGLLPIVVDALLQPDGKILVLASTVTQSASTPGMMLARFNESGALDTSFGAGGIVQTSRLILQNEEGGLAVLPSGKILVGGTVLDNAAQTTRLGLARFNANGAFDTAFATQGLATAPPQGNFYGVSALLPTSDGGAVIVARSFEVNRAALVKLTASGSLASGFGTAGVATFDGAANEATNATLAADGGIVLVGHSPGEAFRVSKFSATGQRLTTFGSADGTNDGKIDITFSGPAQATSVVMQSDTRLVVAGWRQRNASRAMALTRLNADGSIDGTWGEFGRTATNVSQPGWDEIFDVAIGADGSIYAGGSSAVALGGGEDRMAVGRFWRAKAPSAMMGPRRINRAGALGYTFTVVYRDDTQVNAESLNNPDIEITGPNGAFYRTRLIGSVPEVGGAQRYANYNLAAPGGTFGAEDNGVYTVRLRSNQISDTEGNLTFGRVLGTITVSIPTLQVLPQQFSGTQIAAHVGKADEVSAQPEEELVSL